MPHGAGREGIKDSDGEAGRESRIVTVRQGGNQGADAPWGREGGNQG